MDLALAQQLHQGIVTHSALKTQEVSAKIAEGIPENHTLALKGDLGVGKTTFVKGLASYWGIKEAVTSPTFNLLCIYQGKRTLVHLDAYRIVDPNQIDSLTLEDFLIPPYCLAVEWPENLGERLPTPHWLLNFTINSDQSHTVQGSFTDSK